MNPKHALIGGILCFLCPAAQAAESQSYTYDPLGRLVSVIHTGSTNNNVRAAYTYDPAGNRTNVEVNIPQTGGNGKKVVVIPLGMTFAVIAVP